MDSTPASLLDRLRQPDDGAAWTQFVHLYTPLLHRWALGLRLQPADAADLIQDVFLAVLRALPQFQYDAGRSFRAWLHTVLRNKWNERQRRRSAKLPGNEAALAEFPDADRAGPFEEAEYRRHLLAQALDLIRPEFTPPTWQAFCVTVLEGRPAADARKATGLTLNAIYLARGRVLRRLREVVAGLLD
jgi:RNA polymerase sigma-70 factor (ECF subfamily)